MTTQGSGHPDENFDQTARISDSWVGERCNPRRSFISFRPSARMYILSCETTAMPLNKVKDNSGTEETLQQHST